MCTSLVKWLNDWQDLVGAIIGGLMGVVGAFIVAYAQRRREENAAAMLLISDFTAFVGSIREVQKAADKTQQEMRSLFIINKLIRLRSHFSPLFEAAKSQVISIDKQLLAAHLSLFQIIYPSYIQALERLSTSSKNIQSLNEDDKFDIDLVVRGIDTLEQHAESALYYLHDLFFGSFILFYRIILPLRRFFWPSDEEIHSKKLLDDPTNNKNFKAQK